MSKQWYVIWATTGQEENTKGLIEQLIDKELYSRCEILYKVRNIKRKGKWEKLIPSYMFIETDRIDDLAAALTRVPKFSLVLQTGGSFHALDERDQKLIKQFALDDEVVDVSKGYIIGDRIYVTEGPLVGMEGYIKRIDRHKRMATVSLNLFDRPTDVSVGLEIVEKRPTAAEEEPAE